MNITKTLFVERQHNPKLAWRHVNNKQIYETIMKSMYGDIDGAAIGESVEDYVKKLFKNQTISICPAGFPECFDITKQLIQDFSPIIYQPWVKYMDLMIKCDFLVLNENQQYDLWEVKAKNNVKKNIDNSEILKDELLGDISFQHYVLSYALGDRYSGNVFLLYLNKEFKKNGPVDATQLIKQEDVTKQLYEKQYTTAIIERMRRELVLDQKVFELSHPYHNEDHLTYFGILAPLGSIWEIPGIGTKKEEFFNTGKIDILTLNDTQKELLLSSKGEISKASAYVELYQQGLETIINKEAIKQKLDSLCYPLFFYDYETVSTPVPLFEGTIPRQHVVAQYSVHKIDKDGKVTHQEAITLPNSQNNKQIVDQLYNDLEQGNGTYIVWFKGFENKRNEEMIDLWPNYQEFFEKVNANTFDLMEVFSELLYFDTRFKGSSSIKKVLPVLTDLTYDHLEIGNGALASTILSQLISGCFSSKQAQNHIDHLLKYCKQDTWAMVKIWEKLIMDTQ